MNCLDRKQEPAWDVSINIRWRKSGEPNSAGVSVASLFINFEVTKNYVWSRDVLQEIFGVSILKYKC